MTERSYFNREPIPFRMMGKEYKYKFLPNVHLNLVVSKVFELALKVAVDKVEKKLELRDGVQPQEIMEAVNDLLLNQIYSVISDVLEYQNDAKVTSEELVNLTSPMEIAQFVTIVINDEEIPAAVEVLFQGLGKLQKHLGTKIPSLTESFSLFSSLNSEKTPSGFNTESQTDKCESSSKETQG